MRVLVTGCNGFIGHSICSVFYNAGHKVVGLGRQLQPSFNALESYLKMDLCVCQKHEILMHQPFDLVIHTIGTASVLESYSFPVDDFKLNVSSWMILLESIKRGSPNAKAILLSSAAVYGNDKGPLAENRVPSPISPYGYHKLISESISKEYSTIFNLKVACLRLFSVFGERQRRLLLWDAFSRLKDNPLEEVFDGTGDEIRDYIWVEDLARIISKVAEKSDDQGFTIMNIASGESSTVSMIINQVKEALKVGTKIRFSGKERRGDPRKLEADISKLKSVYPEHSVSPLSLSISKCIAAWKKK